MYNQCLAESKKCLFFDALRVKKCGGKDAKQGVLIAFLTNYHKRIKFVA